jgi:hypothetical protein
MKENRLLLCIHQIGDLGKNNSKYFTFMNYFDRFAIKSTRNSNDSPFRRFGAHQLKIYVLDLENSLEWCITGLCIIWFNFWCLKRISSIDARRNVEMENHLISSWFDGEPLIIVSHEEILRIYFTKITQSIDTQ